MKRKRWSKTETKRKSREVKKRIRGADPSGKNERKLLKKCHPQQKKKRWRHGPTERNRRMGPGSSSKSSFWRHTTLGGEGPKVSKFPLERWKKEASWELAGRRKQTKIELDCDGSHGEVKTERAGGKRPKARNSTPGPECKWSGIKRPGRFRRNK